jgi:hypothetical protein
MYPIDPTDIYIEQHPTPYTVICDGCNAEGPADLGESGAIESWNTRPVEDALLEACEAMMTHLEDYPPQFYEKGRDDGRDYCVKIAHAAITKAKGEA